jgi:hypothetical protein
MKKKTPNMARVTRKATMFAPAKVRLRNSERSSIGARRCRSIQMNRASPAAALPNRARIVGDVQP